MISILSWDGTKLIPKSPVNASNLAGMRINELVPDVINIEELEALGERHLGCGHDI